MKILHTSDWHLGKSLYAKKDREAEQKAFFAWLLNCMQENAVDVLLVAGDIFDTAAPSISSQKIYFDFLREVKKTGCKHVVIVAGNHDSPSFLQAPKAILSALDIWVVGHAQDQIENQVWVLDNELIICAVPFLREKDISTFVSSENYQERSLRINEGIKNHYKKIAELALQKQAELGKKIPIVATGHLSVMGGKRNEDDGVRETYIGNIEAVGADIFPNIFDYVALGHYHIPSGDSIKNHIRYCGSPIPMGFGEAGQQKCVYIIECPEMKIHTIEIPVFQRLESIKGDKKQIQQRLEELKTLDISVWVELEYIGEEIIPDFAEWANNQVKYSKIEILRIKSRQSHQTSLTEEDTAVYLEELDHEDVFNILLEQNQVSDEQKKELLQTYHEIYFEILNPEL